MYAARTQPNMRTHLVISLLVLLGAMLLRVGRDYVVDLVIIIAVVLALELLNTAVESIVDLLTVTEHPLAKTAKDAAAGAVLVASIAAVVDRVHGLLQRHHQRRPARLRSGRERARATSPSSFSPSWRSRRSSPRPGSGGVRRSKAGRSRATRRWPSPPPRCSRSSTSARLAALLAYFVAFLVAQSRVEAKIHSSAEVLAGSVLGTVVALAVYLLARAHLSLPG